MYIFALSPSYTRHNTRPRHIPFLVQIIKIFIVNLVKLYIYIYIYIYITTHFLFFYFSYLFVFHEIILNLQYIFYIIITFIQLC